MYVTSSHLPTALVFTAYLLNIATDPITSVYVDQGWRRRMKVAQQEYRWLVTGFVGYLRYLGRYVMRQIFNTKRKKLPSSQGMVKIVQ